MPIVSVVVPVYNAENYLEKCLDSILSQTLQDIEIICVNDGSSDRSLEILHQYEKQDKRVRVFSQENAGAGPARNWGISKAVGKYLSILDADDFFERTMLEALIEKAESDKYEIVVCNAWQFDHITHEISEMTAIDMKYFSGYDNVTVFSKKNFGEYLFNFTSGSTWNKLFLRSFVIENNLFFQDIRFADDFYFTLLALAKAQRIGILNKRLLYYRTSNVESQQGQVDRTPIEFLEAYYGLQKTLIREGLYEQLEKSFMNRILDRCEQTLYSLSQYDSFERLYNKLRKEYFQKFNFCKYEQNYFRNKSAYKLYQEIKKYSPAEYLFLYNMQQKKCWGRGNKNHFIFPFELVEKNDNVVLYGAGAVGKAFYSQVLCTECCNIVLWVDKNSEHMNVLVDSPLLIKNIMYDKIVIALEDESVANTIKEKLLEWNVPSEKIIWEDPEIKI